MRSIFILAVFGMMLLQPAVSRAETYLECLTRCSTEMSSGNANCPPPGDEARDQCLQDNRKAMNDCINSCPKAAPADTHKDTPMDAPKDN